MTSVVRADQVGSLLRPPELLRARQAFAQGSLSAEALRTQEDAAILHALERQRQVGLPVLSDGEFRRGSWLTAMADSVEGFVPRSRMVEWHGPGGGQEASTSQIVGAPLRQKQRLTIAEAPFLEQHAGGRFKVTLPAPSNFYVISYQPGVTDSLYATRGEMVAEIVRIVRAEVQALIAEGVPYIQLDAPYYGWFIDPHQRQELQAFGIDPDAALSEVIAADNTAIDGLARDGLTLALHICRGNSRSRWFAEGAYDPIAEQLFGSLAVDTFLLEYDSPRDGSFDPLRYLPAGKTAVLGLVTTKEATLESPDSLRRRIDEAARYLPLDQLALSPQCGFASVAAGNLLSEEDQWRKLDLVVSTARAVWG